MAVPRLVAAAPLLRPNVLWIISDQHRADVAGFAGNELASTPNLDGLAARSARITDVYCQAPLCVPSRQSILTGVYPHTHGAYRNWDDDWGDQRTIAHDFTDAGYATTLIGKSHCATGGFERVQEGKDLSSAFSASHPGAKSPGWDVVMRVPRRERTTAMWMNDSYQNAGPAPIYYMERAIVDETLRFLKDRPPDRPFFAWVSFRAPHPPLFPPGEYLARYADVDIPLPADDGRPPLLLMDTRRLEEMGFDPANRIALQNMTRAYYAATAWMDFCVGEILGGLHASGADRDTLVIYTSDHGELLGQHGLIGKQRFFEGATRVPCLIRLPGRVAPAIHHHVAEHLDLTATVYDLAGVRPGRAIAGRSLEGLLVGAGTDWEDVAISEMADSDVAPREGVDTPPRKSLMIRQGAYKYVEYREQTQALYDLRNDPEEQVNRVGDPDQRERVAALRERLARAAPDPWAPFHSRREWREEDT